jgi:hypothetical protein
MLQSINVYMNIIFVIPNHVGQYPLTVSNTWSNTKLFINDDINDIVEFKKRFPLILYLISASAII